jgi:hypothetical protein
MHSNFVSLYVSVFPWIMLAAFAMQLWRSARIYQRTRRITAQLTGIIAMGIVFGCFGLSEVLSNASHRGLAITTDLVGLAFAVLTVVAFIVASDQADESKPST